MKDRIPLRVLDAIAAEPWAITDAGLRQIIAVATREADVEAVEAKLGRPLENTRAVSVRDGVAVIPVTGPIFQRANLFTRISGATSIQDLATDFTTSNEDPSVRAIVLDMDTPGGTAHGPSELGRLIRSRRGSKPVVVFGGGATVASAGYWFAAAADERVSAETTLWGSIGTLISATKPAKPKEGAAQEFEFVYSKAPKKRVDLESEEGQAQLRTWVDDLGDVFVANIAEWMGISEEKVLSDFGQGDLLIASKALEAGMIDRIATLEEVISELATKTRSGNYLSPRIVAKNNVPTSSAKERSMDPNATNAGTQTTPDATAQLEALRKRNEELETQAKENESRLQSEALSRIAAEVESFKAPLLAKGNGDLRFNVQSVAAFASLMLVAKAAAAGLSAVKVGEKSIALDAKSIGAFVAEQIAGLTSSAPGFTPPTQELEPAAARTKSDVTLADFAAAAVDPKAAKKIDAAVRERQKTNAKFSVKDLHAEIVGCH